MSPIDDFLRDPARVGKALTDLTEKRLVADRIFAEGMTAYKALPAHRKLILRTRAWWRRNVGWRLARHHPADDWEDW